jgi:deaminated glutathione amidase
MSVNASLGGDAKGTAALVRVRVAAVQMCSGGELASNLATVTWLVAAAAELVVLPENFALMGETERAKCAIAECLEAPQVDGPILSCLRALAREHQVTLVGGGMPERSADVDRPYNTAVVVTKSGDLALRYRKIHLFDVDLADGSSYRESDTTSAGDSVVVASDNAETTQVRLGLSVCYDVRFPELYRQLAQLGANVIVVPAAFTVHTGKDHWHALLRARAIENQVFVVAAAQCGSHPRGRTTYGKSLIVDAWGDVIAQAPDGEGICVADLDLSAQCRIRAQMPVLRHRRL